MSELVTNHTPTTESGLMRISQLNVLNFLMSDHLLLSRNLIGQFIPTIPYATKRKNIMKTNSDNQEHGKKKSNRAKMVILTNSEK